MCVIISRLSLIKYIFNVNFSYTVSSQITIVCGGLKGVCHLRWSMYHHSLIEIFESDTNECTY